MTINRKQAPPIVDAVNFNLQLKPYQAYTLRNGVPVYAVNAGAEEVMQLEWVFFAGNSQEEQNLVAATTNFLLRNGTNTKTAFQLNEYFEYYGAYVNRACYNETATISMHCLSKHVGELLPVVKEMITQSTMPSEELAIYKQNMKQRLKVSLKKSDFVAGRLIDTYLYGENHPYGKYSSAEDFDALERDQLLHFYNQYYIQGKLMLFVAGKLPENINILLDQHFGDLPNNPVEVKEHQIVLAQEKKYRITNDPNGVQGSIRMARSFPNRHHPDFLKVQVLNALFG
ncbi:MAG TPA: insulinase family protein, partial [Chitinophagaceae bacterium]|nr:insulinase family protein [Chitinophagaceae bacterium]